MHKRNSPSAGSRPRNLVYQAVAGFPAGSDSGIQIGNSVADMMDAGAASSQELAHRAFLFHGSQQLDLGVTKRECQDGGPINHLGWMRLDSENIPVKGKGGFQIRNSNTDMSNAGAVEHRFLQRFDQAAADPA